MKRPIQAPRWAWMVAAALALSVMTFWLGRQSAPSHGGTPSGSQVGQATPAAPGASGAAGAGQTGERRVLYWHDPMVPGQRFDKPGKSPFMDMQLVPVYADEANSGGVSVPSHVMQNLGLRTATVGQQQVAAKLEVTGTVQVDERQLVSVQSRVSGYVEQLMVSAPLSRVAKGQALAKLYAPDWVPPLLELQALTQAGSSQELRDAARARAHTLSIPTDLIRRAESGAPVDGRYVLVAPVTGVVQSLGVRAGEAVSVGATLFQLASLDRVWVVAEVPERQWSRLSVGQQVLGHDPADPQQAFTAKVLELVPLVNAATRTVTARMVIDNPKGRWVPGMLVSLALQEAAQSRVVVPTEAVIRTGKRVVAIVQADHGRLQPRTLQLGRELGEVTEVLSGLSEGETVVVSGQFLVDSEAQLKAVLDGMAPAAAVYQAEGRVEQVDGSTVMLSHGPVPALKWPAMTMGFDVAPQAVSGAPLQAGEHLVFEFKQGGDSGWTVVRVLSRRSAP